MNSLPGVAPSVPAEVADNELFWVDGGLLHGWAVAHSRLGHPLGTGDQQVRFMFTQSNHTAVPLIQQWVEHLGSVGVDADRGSSRVFWRIAVRQRSLALTAQPRGNVADAIESARQVSSRAAALTVSFGFAPSEPIPKWVVRDNDVPVFVGLPHHHLVRVTDPRASLAALVAGAHVRTKVHEIT
ncbi:MAG: hypothetical protein JWR52_24 [Marmoricola sp.]|nr:hypothetical protein [Marmoricola sp.]